MFLFVALTLLSFLNAYSSRIVNLLFKLWPGAEGLQAVTDEINQIREDMSKISMVDEFAKHARLQRRLNKLIEEKKTKLQSHSGRRTKVLYIVRGVFLAVVNIFLLGIVWSNRTTVVLRLPDHFLYPLDSLLNWFQIEPGCITVPAWFVMSSSASASIARSL